jgi:hypothetical protein
MTSAQRGTNETSLALELRHQRVLCQVDSETLSVVLHQLGRLLVQCNLSFKFNFR